MRSQAGSEGIYFVIRMPDRWQLVVFRFEKGLDGGHPEFWEAYVTPMLADAWAPHLFGEMTETERSRRKQHLKAELDLHYDGFPRGRVTWVEENDRFIVYHGRNLKPAMHVTRQSIEQAFGIADHTDWKFDDHEQCSAFSAEGVRSALRLKERWKVVQFDTP